MNITLDVKQWAKEKFNLDLDDWQVEYILDNSKDLILRMGRKCGKTTAMACKIVWESGHDGYRVLILSRGQRQSSSAFDTVRQMFHSLDIEILRETRTEIELANGYRVLCLPSGYTGVTIRTYSFHKIYYDEAAYIPDEVYDSTTPCLAVHGIQKTLASTPCGTRGFFHDEEFSGNFKIYHKKTTESPRVSKEFLLKERKRMGKIRFQQEYEAEYTEIADSLFHTALIKGCMKCIDWKNIEKGSVFLGIDFARFGEDDNVIAYCHYFEGKAYIKVEVMKGKYRLTSIVERIRMICEGLRNVRKIVTDEGGLGSGPTDMLTDIYGTKKVIGISNQKRSERIEQGRTPKMIKEDLYTNLIVMMENDRIVIDDDKEVFNSLHQVRYKYTKDGLLSISGINDHIAEAIVRCVFPLMTKAVNRPWIKM